MKSKFYIPAVAAMLLFSFSACEDDYSEASSKHVYGETENVPLKGSDAANGTTSVTLREDPVTVSLADFDEPIKAAMDMTMDEALAGIDNGTVRFYVVNPNRRVWDKTPANCGDNTWGISAQGSVTGADNAAYTVKFDRNAKTLTYALGPAAVSGTVGSIVVGFVKIDGDSTFPVNFRIACSVTVPDKSMVEVTGTIPTGDYSAYSINFADYAENIEYALGVTDLTGFAKDLDTGGGNKYIMYLLDGSGNRFGGDGQYTANGLGYWADASNNVTTWGADGFHHFVELAPWDDETEDYATNGGIMNIGRAPGVASGEEVNASFVLVPRSDAKKALTFIVKLVCE